MRRISKICVILWLQMMLFVSLPQAKGFCDQHRVPGSELPHASSIRAAYFHLASPEQGAEYLDRLSQHGFNAALVADGGYQLRGDSTEASRWQTWGRLAGKYDIQLFPVIHFAVPREFREGHNSYRPYVNRDGEVYPATPCPLDRRYWNRIIEERFQTLATLARTTAIAGALFDTEMYGSEISLYTDLCYCDVCWQRFIRSQSGFIFSPADGYYPALFLPRLQRSQYLSEQHLFEQYTIFQWEQLQHILSQITSSVQHIQPHFQVGFLGYRYNWFYSALVYGLGTPEHPVLVFSESSYIRGYTPYVELEQDRVKSQQASARYIPGLWIRRFFPRDIPRQLVDLAEHTDGYWIYTADNLWRDPAPSLHDASETYWAALKTTNETLRSYAQHSESANRDIPSVHQSSFYDPEQRRLSRPQDVQYLLERMTDKTPAYQGSSLTYRGQSLFHCLPKTNGTIQITHVPLGKDTDPELFRSFETSTTPVAYTLFDEEGLILQKGEINPGNSPTTIRLPEHPTELVSLLLDSGVNGARIAISGVSWLVEASSTFPLETFQAEQQYALYVSSHQTYLPFRAHCPPQESASVTIFAPDYTNSSTTHITGFTEFQIDTHPSPEPEFWTVSTAPVSSSEFGDLRLYLYDYEFPYLLPLRKDGTP